MWTRVRLRTKSSEHHALITCDGADRSTIHPCGHNLDHDVACEHPAAGPVRKRKTAFCFPRRVSAVFCTGRSGCESAQSVSRSSFRRPQHVAGCSRCERSLDRLCWCAASRTIARLTSALPPSSPLPFSCDGSDACTACETLHPGDTPSVHSPPAACAPSDGDESVTGEDPVLPDSDAINVESDPRSTASGCGPRHDDPSSAYAVTGPNLRRIANPNSMA